MTVEILRTPTSEMIARRLAENINAELVQYTYQRREGYTGVGKDIFGDFVAIWKRPDRWAKSGVEWGTHQGCIRGPESELFATLFWGHYGQEELKAREDFTDRVEKLG